MTCLLGVGSSHLFAIDSGYGILRKEGDSSVEFHSIQLRETRYKPLFVYDNAKPILNQFIRAEVGENLERFSPAAILCCIGGGIHIEIGLAQHPRSFDFILPDSPDLNFIAEAEIIPYSTMKETIARRNRPFFTILQLVRELTTIPMYQLCPPPPIFNSERIAETMVKRGDPIKISPASLRFKIWRMFVTVLSEFCDEAGVNLVAPPKDTIGSCGFLKEEYASADAVHGNKFYGKLALLDLTEILSSAGETCDAPV